ncbi:MAG: glycosyltransferase, partial [Pseudomonadota bacterium]
MSGRGPTPITFAVPGDIDALTGGYIYEKSLLFALRDAGWDVAHLRLPGSYPDVTPADEDATIAALTALPADRPILMDGFLTGATDPAKLAQVAAPYVAICHHPLASETGIDPARAARLHEIERANLGRAAHVLVPSPHTAKALARDYGVRAERLTVALPGRNVGR